MERSRSAAARRKGSRPDRERTAKHPVVRVEGGAPLMLLVDDSEDIREIYSTFAVHAGLRVEHAVDGEHALFKVLSLVPDVVVMDLSMPVLDGWRAIEAIRAHPRTKHVVIIALTGHVTPQNLRRAEEAGADAVLTKPCDPGELLAIVQAMLDR